MSASIHSCDIGTGMENRVELRQRSRRLGRLLLLAIIIVVFTATAARGMTKTDRMHYDDHPSSRQRIACMC